MTCQKFFFSKSVKRILTWSTYMMLSKPEWQYFLSNLAAGYARIIILCLIVGGSNYKFWGKKLQVY